MKITFTCALKIMLIFFLNSFMLLQTKKLFLNHKAKPALNFSLTKKTYNSTHLWIHIFSFSNQT